MTISEELLDELLKGCERPEDLLGDASLNRPDFTGGCFVQRQATLSSVFRFA
ncbi:hypothetical protein GLP59_10660 [Sulfitobacter sp. M220]|jgi:hypothetical protein|uniref:hypothetical protein n=1 Tax=unclassified Sulfitobacter TaxID=196795 RepID=UPI001EF157B7|nr:MULTISPECIES: hypothetical protein [unclassified Sulfitobacter]MCF7726724.1 hypothetical protein [Sulfitobacter sp. M22]MCF7778100.1 hypothetical protein [Sulfitobacter sp. M220]